MSVPASDDSTGDADVHPTGDSDERIAAEVDARGLSCPMPVIELARAIQTIDVGDAIELLATDPAAKVDVPVWCRMQRQRLRSQQDVDGVWRFVVERLR